MSTKLLEKYNYSTDIIAALYTMYKFGILCSLTATEEHLEGAICNPEELDVYFNSKFLDKAANLPILISGEDFDYFHEFTKKIRELTIQLGNAQE